MIILLCYAHVHMCIYNIYYIYADNYNMNIYCVYINKKKCIYCIYFILCNSYISYKYHINFNMYSIVPERFASCITTYNK